MAKAADAKEPAGGTPRRRNRKVDVVRAAVDVFWRNGYAASSVQDVADSVGVLKGSLYYYIQSKEDLLFQIIEDVHAQSREILDEVVRLDADPLERLRTYIERHVAWYLENVEEVSVYFRDWRSLTGARLEQAIDNRHSYERVIRDMIVQAQDRGDVDRGVDPKYASFYVLAAVNHVPDWYRRDGSDSPAHIAAAYADLTVGTLVGTRARTPARGNARQRSGAAARQRRKAA
jgi:AcrR family transcriptional regulator